MKGKPNMREQAVKALLVKRGYEFISSGKKGKDGVVEIEANKLQPVKMKNSEVIYMPIPQTLQLKADNEDIKIINENASLSDLVIDADNFAKMLVENNKIEGMGNSESVGATHSIEVNESGQKIIRRRRFNAI